MGCHSWSVDPSVELGRLGSGVDCVFFAPRGLRAHRGMAFCWSGTGFVDLIPAMPLFKGEVFALIVIYGAHDISSSTQGVPVTNFRLVQAILTSTARP